MLYVAKPLRSGERVVEASAGADGARQRAAARLVERLTQPVLGLALRVVAGRWTAALGPRRPDLLLRLVAVREPVLRVPDGSALALDAEDVPAWWLQGERWHGPRVDDRRDTFGTHSGFRPNALKQKAPISGAFKSG